ncbi:MAG: cupin domain-containing protein [Candidatus Moranbacteria bacterium]|nr:cupin domain-containing protein [Candidatus Moranbacteria bacterium]
MQGYIGNIEQATLANEYFRKVLYTDKKAQLVVMSLQPGEEIGMEVHKIEDQFIRVEKGSGKAIVSGIESILEDGVAVVIPAGTEHNIINTSAAPMKLYTLYSPPHHKDGTIHKTKEEAELSEEHFDGETTEAL